MAKRVLLIGGGGFIGSWLGQELLASGREVTVLGRSAVPLRFLHPSIRYVAGDFADTNLLRGLLAEHDEVVDLAYATVPNTSFDAPLHDLLQNLPVAVSLFAEAIAANVRRVVVVSSGGTVYGEARTSTIREDHPTCPISPYGITKLTIEQYARWFHAVHGLPVICVRPANAFGEGQIPFRGQGFVATAIAAAIEGRPLVIFGETGTVRDYIHVSDVATAIVAALDGGECGETYNIGTGVGFSNLEVVAAINHLAASIGKRIDVDFAEARRFDVQVNILDSAKLMSRTGWLPRVELNEGLARTWRWFLDSHGC